MKCMGASICVPLCAPSEYTESVNGSPRRMSFRNSNFIGASPSYTGVAAGSSVVVASIQCSDVLDGARPEVEAHAAADIATTTNDILIVELHCVRERDRAAM